MRKYILCFFLTGFFISSHASHYLEEKPEQINYYRPSFNNAVKKIILGSLCCFLANNSYSDSYQNQIPIALVREEIGNIVGYKIMTDGIYEAFHWGYHKFKDYYYYNHLNKRSQQRISRGKDSRPSQIKQQDEFYWNKGINITRSLTNSALSINFLLLAVVNEYDLINEGINPLTLHREDCSSAALMDCHPFLMAGATGLGLVSLVYNFNELYASIHQTKLRQGNRPFMGVMSGWSEIIAGSQVFSFFPSRQIVTFFDPTTGNIHKEIIGSSFGEYLHDLLVFHGSDQLCSNSFQILNNLKNFSKSQVTVSINVISPEENILHKKEFTKREVNHKRPFYTESKQDLSASSDFSTHVSIRAPIENESDGLESKKEKIKTKGIPDRSKIKSELSRQKIHQKMPMVENCEKRMQALQQVNNYRRFNAIKSKYINPLLSEACKYVNGEIEPIDGSEWALVFYRENQRVSIKFEIPHARDSNVYKGFKLKRILNAIETVYMYNWDKEAILNYMNNYGIRRFYQVPNSLLYILWNRPDL